MRALDSAKQGGVSYVILIKMIRMSLKGLWTHFRRMYSFLTPLLKIFNFLSLSLSLSLSLPLPLPLPLPPLKLFNQVWDNVLFLFPLFLSLHPRQELLEVSWYFHGR